MASIRDLILNVVEKKEGNALVAAANDLDKLSHGMDAGSDKTKTFTKDTQKLNAEIEKSTARIKELHKQFAASGDKSLFGDIRKEEQNVRNLQKTLGVLQADFHDAGKQGATSFFGGFTSGLQGFEGTPVLGPILAGLIIGAVASLGPILLSELGGLVAAAVGTVGVVGGVLSAVKDPRVKSAFTQFSDNIQTEFFKGDAFVEPIRKSLAVLERDFASLNLDEAFAKAAPDLQIIVQGLGQLAKNIMPGFNAALSRSGPFAKAASDGFADLGLAIGYLVDRVTQSKGSLEGLKTLFAFVSATIVGIADLIYHAGQVFDWFIRQNEKFFRAQAAIADFFGRHGVADDFRAIADSMKQLQDDSTGVPENIKGVGDAFNAAADPTERYAKLLNDVVKAEDDFINKSLAVDNADVAVMQGFADLNENLIKGTKNWDLFTQAGRDNLKMIYEQIGALDRDRQAEIARSDGTVDAINEINKEYDALLGRLLNVAAAAGDSKANLEALAKKYFIDLIITVEERIQRNQVTKATNIDKALANLGFYADGGTVPGPIGAPQLAVVHGKERVLTPSQAAAMDRGPSGGDGAAMQVMFSGNLDTAVATMFMKLVRSGEITISSKAIVA